jgi:uncharacterized protein
MTLDLPLSEIAWLTAALLAGGLFTGFFAGLLGVGGGAIIVPVLFELFRFAGVDESIRMQLCVATSLAIIIPTSVNSVRSHYKRGAVELGVIKTLGPWVVGGAIAGVFIASHAPSEFLKAAFIASTLFIASRLAFGDAAPIEGARLPGQPWDGIVGAGIGLISTLIGIGGGAYVTAFMKFRGWAIHKAVATASGFGPIIAIPAVLGFIAEGWGSPLLPPLSLGYVSFLGVAVIAPVSVLAAPLGVRVAHRLQRRTLELVFMAFLLAVCARFTASLLFGV